MAPGAVSPYFPQRQAMVERQLVARGIKDTRVLAAMSDLPREAFVEPHQVADAYKDQALPIAEGQAISQPYMVAVMTEALQLSASDRVLEIGTGSGYQAAVLAQVAAWVVTVERRGFLAARARQRLDALGMRNIQVEISDGTLGFAGAAPYDAIIVTAEAPKLPLALLDQLTPGGRLIIPLAGPEGAILMRLVKTGHRTWTQAALMRCFFVPLVGQEGYLSEEGRPSTRD